MQPIASMNFIQYLNLYMIQYQGYQLDSFPER